MLKDKILAILQEFESGKLDSGKLQTSTHSFNPYDSGIEDYLECSAEEQRNKKLKYVTDTYDDEHGHYETISYIGCPNIDFLKDKLCDDDIHDGFLRAELERMKADGLILIGTQTAQQFILDSRGDLTYFTRGDGWSINTDSIVLTTKGKSAKDYFLYQFVEQRFAAWSLVVSFAAFGLSVYAVFFQ